MVSRVCISEKSTAPLRAPERPGDALIIDNHRIMHARTAYRGARHLRHCHISTTMRCSVATAYAAGDWAGYRSTPKLRGYGFIPGTLEDKNRGQYTY